MALVKILRVISSRRNILGHSLDIAEKAWAYHCNLVNIQSNQSKPPGCLIWASKLDAKAPVFAKFCPR